MLPSKWYTMWFMALLLPFIHAGFMEDLRALFPSFSRGQCINKTDRSMQDIVLENIFHMVNKDRLERPHVVVLGHVHAHWDLDIHLCCRVILFLPTLWSRPRDQLCKCSRLCPHPSCTHNSDYVGSIYGLRRWSWSIAQEPLFMV